MTLRIKGMVPDDGQRSDLLKLPVPSSTEAHIVLMLLGHPTRRGNRGGGPLLGREGNRLAGWPHTASRRDAQSGGRYGVLICQPDSGCLRPHAQWHG